MKLTPAFLSSAVENASEQSFIQLSNQKITHVEDISFCICLRKLDLSKNRMRSAEALSGLQYCKSISWLNLSFNQLDSLGYLDRMAEKLTVLNISHNSFTILPTSLASLKKLKALIANDNQLKHIDPLALPKSLETLVISRNQIESLDGVLGKLVNLEKLSASHNKLHVFPEISKCMRLCELRLNDNKILQIPKDPLTLPPSIEILDLGNNLIGSLRHLKSLTLKGCKIESGYENDITSKISSLTTLDNKRIGPSKRRRRPRKIEKNDLKEHIEKSE